MRFADFVSAVQATLIAECDVELCPLRSSHFLIEWSVGTMMVRLEVNAVDTVALSASIGSEMIRPVSYAMTFRSVRNVAHDLAALIELPTEER